MKVADLTGFTHAEMRYMAKKINTLRPEEDGYVVFDYPDYGGLKKEIYEKLTSDQVDYIQEEIQHIDQELDMTVLAGLLARGNN